MKKNLLVGQSGGPTAAINATLAGVISAGIKSEEIDTVYGCVNGIKGALSENFLNLTEIFENEETLNKIRNKFFDVFKRLPDENIAVIDATHNATENIIVPVIASYIRKKLENRGIDDVEVIESKIDGQTFVHI